MSWAQRIFFIAIFVFSAKCFANVEEHDFKGQHLLASYMDCDPDALRDVVALENAMIEAVKTSNATVLQSAKHIFPPDGMTMVILLSESHASIHTYPEYGACFVDLFTCGPNCSNEQFDKALRSYLKPKSCNSKLLIRDKGISEQ